MKKFVNAFLIISITAIFISAQEQSLKRLQGLSDTRYHKVDYTPIKHTYHIFVRLPENYKKEVKYPTVYLLDGGVTFPMLGGYYRYLNFAKDAPDMIIVGISYGTADWKKGNQRSRDFTVKSKERDFWGGAENFSTFFQTGLFPLIEKNYSSDPKRRIIFGQSLGGQYALYAAQAKTGLFWGHIASNPALHRNLEFFLKTHPAILAPERRIHVFVSSGSNDDPTFKIPAKKWMDFWKHKKGADWNLKTTILEDQNHFSAAPEAFRQGIKWIFNAAK